VGGQGARARPGRGARSPLRLGRRRLLGPSHFSPPRAAGARRELCLCWETAELGQGGIVLLRGRTGCEQADGPRGLVCIYLYGVGCEPPVTGCAGRASTYLYGDTAFTSILTQLASRCSGFSPLPSLEPSLEVALPGGFSRARLSRRTRGSGRPGSPDGMALRASRAPEACRRAWVSVGSSGARGAAGTRSV